jgi:tRNA wybutosine-synthesizing protein 4
MVEQNVSARTSKPAPKKKAQVQDDSIMAVCIPLNAESGDQISNLPSYTSFTYSNQTNNSSIVSKRSVERLYFPNEPHFFRHFVKKPQRRSPLINRGYWLRMKAVDYVVRQFLETPSKKPKVVINLGCG